MFEQGFWEGREGGDPQHELLELFSFLSSAGSKALHLCKQRIHCCWNTRRQTNLVLKSEIINILDTLGCSETSANHDINTRTCFCHC